MAGSGRLSLGEGMLQLALKQRLMCFLLKKAYLDPTTSDNFCSVSVFSFLKKVVGKMVDVEYRQNGLIESFSVRMPAQSWNRNGTGHCNR